MIPNRDGFLIALLRSEGLICSQMNAVNCDCTVSTASHYGRATTDGAGPSACTGRIERNDNPISSGPRGAFPESPSKGDGTGLRSSRTDTRSKSQDLTSIPSSRRTAETTAAIGERNL